VTGLRDGGDMLTVLSEPRDSAGVWVASGIVVTLVVLIGFQLGAFSRRRQLKARSRPACARVLVSTPRSNRDTLNKVPRLEVVALPARNRSNPLALAVLVCLAEQPRHPYDVATTLRQRQKHESVRLNYGSLYGVVESLERRGLIEAQETLREGKLPERTVYRLTEAGLIEVHDWLTELLSTPVRDYPAFQAALSFLPALPPADVVTLLREREGRLEMTMAQAAATRELAHKHGIPRLFWVESEYEAVLREAELGYVRSLIADIESGSLDGLQLWHSFHEGGDGPWPRLPQAAPLPGTNDEE
jgi:DNA-binding PadR family transcriptional regulator